MRSGLERRTKRKALRRGACQETVPGGSVVKNPPVNAGDSKDAFRWGRKESDMTEHTHTHTLPCLCPQHLGNLPGVSIQISLLCVSYHSLYLGGTVILTIRCETATRYVCEFM